LMQQTVLAEHLPGAWSSRGHAVAAVQVPSRPPFEQRVV
jgi:hypothetical protein